MVQPDAAIRGRRYLIPLILHVNLRSFSVSMDGLVAVCKLAAERSFNHGLEPLVA